MTSQQSNSPTAGVTQINLGMGGGYHMSLKHKASFQYHNCRQDSEFAMADFTQDGEYLKFLNLVAQAEEGIWHNATVEFRKSTTSTIFNSRTSARKVRSRVHRGIFMLVQLWGHGRLSRDSARPWACKDVICLISEVCRANLTPLPESCWRLTAVRFRKNLFWWDLCLSCANFDNIVL